LGWAVGKIADAVEKCMLAVMPHLLRHRLFFEVYSKVYMLLSDFVRIIIYIYIG